jgi:octaprenyl-diphosphate synthase
MPPFPPHPPAMPSLREVQALAAADMAAMNNLIRTRLSSDVLLINQIAEHIVAAGGKRLRPMLHLLAARACGYSRRATRTAGGRDRVHPHLHPAA